MTYAVLSACSITVSCHPFLSYFYRYLISLSTYKICIYYVFLANERLTSMTISYVFVIFAGIVFTDMN